MFPEGQEPVLKALSRPLCERGPRDLPDGVGSEPVFVKTHRLPPPDDDRPTVYLVRDGRDAVVSYAHFVRARATPGFKDRTLDQTLEVLIRQDGEFGSWSRNVREWTRREAPTAVVHFEDLTADPQSALRAAAWGVGVQLGEPSGTLPSTRSFRERDPTLVRTGGVGAWRSALSPRLQRLFWELHGAEMEAMGYPRS